MKDTNKQLDDFEKRLEDIRKQYSLTCEFFLISSSDEKATDS